MKKILIISFLIFTILFSFFSTSYATVEVTEEAFENSFEKMKEKIKDNVSEDENTVEDIDIDKENNKLILSTEKETFTTNYNFSDKPTFTSKVSIQKGISYDDYKEKEDALMPLPLIGYIAIANLYDIDVEDSLMYFTFSYLGAALNDTTNFSDSYVIIDDSNNDDSVTITGSDNKKTIYTSEFGDRVMEYVNGMYKNKMTISDSDGINSFTLTIEKQNTTDTSCELVSTLVVNTEADFSKISETSDIILGDDITEENADYILKLKVGQKCIIKSNKKLTGFSSFGGGIEFSKDYTELTATKTGTKQIRLNIGDIEKSLLLTVEENTENKTLDPVTLEINISDKDLITNTTNTIINTTNKNNTLVNLQPTLNKVTSTQNKLPQTGDFFNEQGALFFLILIAIVGIIFLLIPNIKYRNVNKKQ